MFQELRGQPGVPPPISVSNTRSELKGRVGGHKNAGSCLHSLVHSSGTCEGPACDKLALALLRLAAPARSRHRAAYGCDTFHEIYAPVCMGAHTWPPDHPMLSKAGPSTCALGCPAPSFTRASPWIILALLPHHFTHLPTGRSHWRVNMLTQLLSLKRLTHLCSPSQNNFLKELSILAAPFLSLQSPCSPLRLGFCPHHSSKTAIKLTTSVANPLVMTSQTS